MRACSGVWVAHGSGSADREVADRHGRVERAAGRGVLHDTPRVADARGGAGLLLRLRQRGPLAAVPQRPHAAPSSGARTGSSTRPSTGSSRTPSAPRWTPTIPIVLVQDYHFGLLPAARSRAPAPRHHHHVLAHPLAERGSASGSVPGATSCCDGLLGSSILGFHTQLHCNNFIDAVDRYLEARIDREQTAVVQGAADDVVRPYPISIEWPSRWAAARPARAGVPRGVFAELGLPADAPARRRRGPARLHEGRSRSGCSRSSASSSAILRCAGASSSPSWPRRAAPPSSAIASSTKPSSASPPASTRRSGWPLPAGGPPAGAPRAADGVPLLPRRRRLLREQPARRHEPGGQGVRGRARRRARRARAEPVHGRRAGADRGPHREPLRPRGGERPPSPPRCACRAGSSATGCAPCGRSSPSSTSTAGRAACSWTPPACAGAGASAAAWRRRPWAVCPKSGDRSRTRAFGGPGLHGGRAGAPGPRGGRGVGGGRGPRRAGPPRRGRAAAGGGGAFEGRARPLDRVPPAPRRHRRGAVRHQRPRDARAAHVSAGEVGGNAARRHARVVRRLRPRHELPGHDPGHRRTRAARGRAPRGGAQLRHPWLHHRQRLRAAAGVRPPVRARRGRGRGGRPGRPSALAAGPGGREAGRRGSRSSSGWEALLKRGAARSALLAVFDDPRPARRWIRRASGLPLRPRAARPGRRRPDRERRPCRRGRPPPRVRRRRIRAYEERRERELAAPLAAMAAFCAEKSIAIYFVTPYGALLRPHRRRAGAHGGGPVPRGGGRGPRQRAPRARGARSSWSPACSAVVAARGSARVIDMLEASRAASLRDLPDFAADGIHLTTTGNAALGRLIARRILRGPAPGSGRPSGLTDAVPHRSTSPRSSAPWSCCTGCCVDRGWRRR